MRSFAKQFPGREQLAIDNFAESARLSPNDSFEEPRSYHAEGFRQFGIGPNGCIDNVRAELSEVKTSIIKRAYEVTSMMLRIDEQITWKEPVKFHKK